jgi:hypothetical protein
VSIKPLPPEAIETFSLVLHPKRKYSARARELFPSGSAVFSPQTRNDCLSWHDGQAGITIATGVSIWADQGPSGDANRNLVQATVGFQPVFTSSDVLFNNKGSVSFDGADDAMQSVADWTGGVIAQPTTWYVVLNTPIDLTVAGGTYIYDGPSSGTSRNSFLGNTPFAGLQPVMGAPAVNVSTVLCVVYDGAFSALYINDATNPAGSGDVGAQGLVGQTLAARYALDVSSFLQVKFAAVGTFSGHHNHATRNTIMTQLGSRYGITVAP